VITKECKIKKYCCLYVSDFHLEMILLPYIKNKIKNANIIILTENDLLDSIKLVLNRMNLNEEEKKKVLEINWNNKDLIHIESEKEMNIIINGSIEFINKKNEEIKKLNLNNINTIECYDISKINKKNINIDTNFEGVLNTNNEIN
jgi:hypothetical protein